MSAIEVKDVHVSFGEVKALRGVDLQVKQGNIYGLLGPNGAGKTTLVNVLTTLLRPDSGLAKVGGFNVLDQPREVRKIIGLAGQFATVDEIMTGRENIEMIGRLYHLDHKTVEKRADNLLKKLSLSDAADRQVKTYSGGMRRRLDLGASLVAQPDILFLDEPTTGLDPRTRLELWDLIRELNESGTTILLTTQYLEEADELADYISLIDEGKLVVQGTADELKAKLGNDIVQVAFESPQQADVALKHIDKATKQKPKVEANRKTIKVPVKDGSKSLINIVRALDEADVDISEISLHRPTLDDVFLTLTNKNGGKS